MVGLQLGLSLSLSAASRVGIPTKDAARARPASTDRGPEPAALYRQRGFTANALIHGGGVCGRCGVFVAMVE
jgi:hypothetical protein